MATNNNKTSSSIDISTNPHKHCLKELKDIAGHSPFFVAIIKGHLEIAEQLLMDEMSDINEEDDELDTPLHWAVLLGNAQAVQFLLINGAEVGAINKHKNNVIMIACINQRLEILRLLINHVINSGK